MSDGADTSVYIGVAIVAGVVSMVVVLGALSQVSHYFETRLKEENRTLQTCINKTHDARACKELFK